MITAQDIRGYKLFAGLNEKELIEVSRLCRRRTCESGEVIFDPQKTSEDIFVVEGGNEAIQIEIPITTHEDRLVIHTLSKGETFGWAALEEQHMRTATARCLENVSIISLNGKTLMQLMENNFHLGYVIMRNLVEIISTRLSHTTVAFRHELRKAKKKLRTPVPS